MRRPLGGRICFSSTDYHSYVELPRYTAFAPQSFFGTSERNIAEIFPNNPSKLTLERLSILEELLTIH